MTDMLLTAAECSGGREFAVAGPLFAALMLAAVFFSLFYKTRGDSKGREFVVGAVVALIAIGGIVAAGTLGLPWLVRHILEHGILWLVESPWHILALGASLFPFVFLPYLLITRFSD